MANRFVRSAVLESTDGIGFNEKEISDEKTEMERRRSAQLEQEKIKRPLFEVLKENREKQDNDWKEKHNPFKAPVGISADDLLFYETAQEEKKRKQQEVATEEEQELQAFAQARQTTVISTISDPPVVSADTSKAAVPTKTPEPIKSKKSSTSLSSFIRVVPKDKALQKRKSTESDSGTTTAKRPHISPSTEAQSNTQPAVTPAQQAPNGSAKPLMSLVAYGSGSDSDS
eukprot:GILK01008586.1.p1 GENE.GILK01008586.1~~GILK01008586.1.p1  ORF type:complete len:239 (+),score=52.90 GILK01008586.1:32-718(+)